MTFIFQTKGFDLMRSAMFYCFILFSSISSAQVSIQINQHKFDFTASPRLAEVLSPIAYQDNWYWPAARLFRSDTHEALTLRNSVIAKLKFLQLSLNNDSAVLVDELIQQINSWQLADRILINLDYDRAQTNPQLNPQFEQGQYKLDLVTRPTSFTVFGLVRQPVVIDLTDNMCAHNYINSAFSQLENKDFVYLIAADGRIDKIGIAYWNAGCVDIMPGSQIYLPFNESQFFSDNRELNRQIVELALNRIM
tara:strand:- start:5910 stop:6662 length:753 start_codon:yes stop_codon:yes gene_type:complete